MFHISSPREGSGGGDPRRHDDWIDPLDVANCWENLAASVEARGKEAAVLSLKRHLDQRWFVYIVRCADDSLYTGVARHLERRLAQHNAGSASRYTRGRLPVTLVYVERSPTRATAQKREYAIKALSRPEKEALIASARPAVNRA